MIKFYAYYSYGGFKDMLVGAQDDPSSCTYYLPLVNAGIDLDPAKQDLPKIKIIGEEGETATLPSGLGRIVCNGGYSVFFSRSLNGKPTLVIRDINGTEKDENGRSIPFVMEFTGDNSDASTLAALASIFIKDPKSADTLLGPLFHYDVKYNGLCFENARLCELLGSISEIEPAISTKRQGLVSLLHNPQKSLIASTLQNDASKLPSRLGLSLSDTMILNLDDIVFEKVELDLSTADKSDQGTKEEYIPEQQQPEKEAPDEKKAPEQPLPERETAGASSATEISDTTETSITKTDRSKIIKYVLIGGGLAALAIVAACLSIFKD